MVVAVLWRKMIDRHVDNVFHTFVPFGEDGQLHCKNARVEDTSRLWLRAVCAIAAFQLEDTCTRSRGRW
jgi:hypothetical protein